MTKYAVVYCGLGSIHLWGGCKKICYCYRFANPAEAFRGFKASMLRGLAFYSSYSDLKLGGKEGTNGWKESGGKKERKRKEESKERNDTEGKRTERNE